MSKRLLLVTDTWYPNINGVVITYDNVIKILKDNFDWQTEIVHPMDFFNISLPLYWEMKMALFASGKLKRKLDSIDAVHIANEGTLGIACRNVCYDNLIPYTTSFHTALPEYLFNRMRIPLVYTYKAIAWFHKYSSNILVPTKTIQRRLNRANISNTTLWSRGVDIELFHPRRANYLQYPRPIQLYVGRLCVDKGINDFLQIHNPGTKIVVGYGPEENRLKEKYKDNDNVKFLGLKIGNELAKIYSSADVFVFPSKTDTFGIVQLEALASGLPIAAYPVPGPLDIINNDVGCLSWDLKEAIENALLLKKEDCIEYVKNNFTWYKCAEIFEKTLINIH